MHILTMGFDVVAAVRGGLLGYVPRGGAVAVALSGGMDSVSMLHAAVAAVRGEDGLMGEGGREGEDGCGGGGGDGWGLMACHVNHHLSARSDAWERFCRRVCDDVGVPLVVRNATPPSAGAGEEWARRERLRAFAELPCVAILAAHHSGDQAETVLFRLLRGAGSLGMSAMRHCAVLPHSLPDHNHNPAYTYDHKPNPDCVPLDGRPAGVLDSRLRGNDGGGVCLGSRLRGNDGGGVCLGSRFRGNDGGGGNDGYRDRMLILRPWIDIPRGRILEYAKACRLRWIEDEDNHNLLRRRNFIRLRALPMMADGGFDCDSLLPLAARRFTDGAALLAELAQMDDDAAAEEVFGARGFRVAYFLGVGESRTRNWLHNALRRRGGRFSERGMAEAARQIFNVASASSSSSSPASSISCNPPSLHLRFGGVVLHEWRGYLFWDDLAPPPLDYHRRIAIDKRLIDEGGQMRVECPELGGVLTLTVRRGAGLALEKTGGAVYLRLRGGGEKVKAARRPRHRVADLLREAGVLPWRRSRLPMVYVGEGLAAVPDIAVAEGYAAAGDGLGVVCGFAWRS